MDAFTWHFTRETAMLSLMFLFQLGNLVPSDAVSAACECVLFDSTYGKEFGLFTSPNWPVPYDDNIECILYTFVAGKDQMVEITFDEFDVQKTNLECIFGDFVKLFLHLKEAAVNERSPYNSILCGRVVDIEQTHYSSNAALIFEFHTDWRKSNSTGFSGTYRFLKVFQTDGHLVPGTQCDYEISNEQSTNRTRGKFFSPQYPSSYPRDIVCNYRFFVVSNYRVKIVFEQIRLQRGDLSCLNSPDLILVYDGANKSSPVIGQLCNTNTFVQLVSSGNELFIEFLSRSHFPGQGFKASYFFEVVTPYTTSSSSPQQRPSAIDVPYLESIRKASDLMTTTTASVLKSCKQEFSSDAAKNGTFTSPNYPEPYPSEVRCIYQFMGKGRERVQITFTDFDLHLAHVPSRECDSVDAVMVFITINGQKERLDNFCGNKVPAQLMSNGPSMTVEFRSYHSSPEVKGFRANYRFVTDFGISSGKMDPSTLCGFTFESEDQVNGTFTSPNYPGLYPRNTECHYFFKGSKSERVQIRFASFDVDGIEPCTSQTASDYVEFSNYVSVDRKIPRHCGRKKPTVIESDGNFFRVTFKSNDKFDGVGFEAFYQFKPHIDPLTVKRVSTTATANSASALWMNEVLISSIILITTVFTLLI